MSQGREGGFIKMSVYGSAGDAAAKYLMTAAGRRPRRNS